MQVSNPVKVYGKPVKRGKHRLVRIVCPHCSLTHDLAPGLRVPTCGSDRAEYIVVPLETSGAIGQS